MKKITHRWQPKSCLLLMLLAFGGVSAPLQAAVETSRTAVKPVVWQITGRVTSAAGEALPGVTVLLKGTTNGTATDVDGRYSLSVPETGGTLIFSFIGYTTQEKTFSGPGTINVNLADDAKSLAEVVVTGYTTQQKRDIIGAVSVVETKELLQTPAANVQQQLQGRVSGVTTSGTGQPGAGAKVRVRGFGSFGANDPLYVVDGVPTSNVNELNPNDIESMQVLKDASSASIYGSRAANGVIIITTRQGKAGTPKLNVNSYYGMQVAPKGPDLLNTEEYGQYLFQSNKNAGQPWNHPQYGNNPNGPIIPDYILPTGVTGTVDESKYNIDPAKGPINQIVRANKTGTDWWDATFDPASIQSHQVGVTGGSEASVYSFSLNYFNQKGIAKYTNYERYTLRANTQSTIAKIFRIGENAQISYNQGNQGPNGGESDIQHIYVNQPIVPVYDIQGNFAGSRGGGLGNARSPVAQFFRGKDNKNSNIRIFGNVFGELEPIKGLTARTSFGVDYNSYYGVNFGFATYERSENVATNSLNERNDYNMNWTWTNTLTFKRMIGETHNITALVGTEAIKNNSRGVGGSRVGLFSDDPNFRILNSGTSGINNFSYGGRRSLSSIFGRIDYGFRDKYLLNATVRRDGSSAFGPENRYGTFPAFGAGWRISGEEFMAAIPFISDLKLRAGWGKLGNQAPVDPNNAYTLYRTTAANNGYDIGGTSTSIVPGFDVDLIGNPTTKWEASTTTNVGLDVALWDNRLNLTIDAYNRRTNDLLVPGQAPATLGENRLAFVNLGDMQNRGFDINATNAGTITSDLSYDVTLTFSKYKNEVLRVGASDADIFESYNARWNQNISRTEKGQPLGSFYGYQIDGFFNNADDLTAVAQTGEHVGGWRFKDQNDDKIIDDKDRTYIGNPHPDFTSGLNLGLRYKAFDISTFFYASVGNDLFNYNKYFTDFNTFQGNRSKTMLYESWRPDNMNAKLPILMITDATSNSVTHDYYVEDGSFLRMRTLQIGYNLPASLIGKAGFGSARIYLQGQNVFTITKYTGIDPDISLINQNGNAAQADLNIGIDAGYFPNPKQYLIGVSFGF